MLKLMMDLKGRFPAKMIKQSRLASTYFDLGRNNEFLLEDIDPGTEKLVKRRIVPPSTGSNSLKSTLLSEVGTSASERHFIGLFANLLDECLELLPEKRISPKAALSHPFLRTSAP